MFSKYVKSVPKSGNFLQLREQILSFYDRVQPVVCGSAKNKQDIADGVKSLFGVVQ